MNINTCIKKSFVVIGKEGSTKDGESFIGHLWENANGHFEEVAKPAKLYVFSHSEVINL